MKRFLLFTWSRHEPGGGWGDFSDSYGTRKKAIQMAPERDGYGEKMEWHIVDTKTSKIVAESDDQP